MATGSPHQPPSSSIPIPTPSSPQRYVSEGPQSFVGSPEQINIQDGGLRSFMSAHSSSSHIRADQSRPSFQRSVSSSTPNSRRGDTISRVQEIASSFTRRSQYERPPDREWTVFGQLMEDEARLRAPPSRGPGTARSTKNNTPRVVSEGMQSYFEGTPSPLGGDRHPSLTDSPPNTEPLGDRLSAGTLPNGAPQYLPSYTDSSEDSDTDRSLRDTSQSHPESHRTWRFFEKLPTIPTLSPVYRNILKCCIAYFIGSLFTFSPYLSGFIADITGDDPGDRVPSPSGHMVATM